MKASLDEPIPGGARLAYVFGSGLLFIFISQVITGLCLALYYVPSAESAHLSVAYITKQVAAGQFLRSLHYYGSSAMIIVLALHFLQTFLYGSFKGRRELLWISGAFLSFLVLGMGFTGYLLPWDQSSYFATAVGTNIVGEVPWIGQWLTSMLRGGDTLGTLTLSRFYFAHVFLIPGMIFLFIGIHIALFRKAGPAGPIDEDPIHPKLPPESFYPRQVIMDMAFALLIMVGLGFLAYLRPVLLGPIADPSNTQFVPRPEWYYLPMFEWLKFWSSRMEVFAVVVIPGILALIFFLLPFLDRNLERRPWRRPIPLLAVTAVLVGMIFLGFKSHLDDLRDSTIAKQLAFQDQQARDYTKAPFHPRMESASGKPLAAAAVNPLVAKGKSVFESNGCSGCHGADAIGTAAAPSLVGITARYPLPKFSDLLHHPNPAMRAGHMPSFDLSAADATALFTYLGSLGTSGGSTSATTASDTPAVPEGSPAPAISRAKSPESKVAPPANSAASNSASVAAGEKVFEAHACFACHGQAGAGTGRVPPLAGLVAGKSALQLSKLLHHPDAKMMAGGMPPFTGSESEETSLIAYIQSLTVRKSASTKFEAARVAPTIGNEANTPPAPPPPAQPLAEPVAKPAAAAEPPESPVAEGRAVFVTNGCAACHGQQGTGTHFAPSLVGITNKFPGEKLPYLIHHPTSKMRDGGMPTFKIHGADMQHLVAYLGSLGTPSAPAATATTTNTAEAKNPARPSNSAGQSLNTAPSAVSPAAAPPLSAEALAGKKIFQRYSCETCHGIGGLHGTIAAPPLAGTASLLPAKVLENLLRHHSIQMQEGGMPLTNMNAQNMKAIVAYIRSLPTPSDSR
ncbi:MAG TPA: cytochrome b N-terminal domain-containing protein [Acidobacteriaceae bacterium]|nr:cytochrome b N-terminal domain-containing protein [Acidobacteriaceae bacterium]